jgi:Cu(I)/Ag(I) efflux system membrane fusion protein
VEADIPEALAGSIATGSAATTTLAAYPGRAVAGRVIAVLPAANADSRTVRARIELRNPDGRLRDGMFAQVSIASRQSGPTALVPSEAIIRSGSRSLVILTTDDGHFKPVEVTVGLEADGKTQVLQGIQAGQRIVVSGQFLIDSEASLQGALTRMQAPDGHAP